MIFQRIFSVTLKRTEGYFTMIQTSQYMNIDTTFKNSSNSLVTVGIWHYVVMFYYCKVWVQIAHLTILYIRGIMATIMT